MKIFWGAELTWIKVRHKSTSKTKFLYWMNEGNIRKQKGRCSYLLQRMMSSIFDMEFEITVEIISNQLEIHACIQRFGSKNINIQVIVREKPELGRNSPN